MNAFLESPTARTLYDPHWAHGIVRVAEKYHDISGEGKTPLKIPHTIPNGEKEYKLFDYKFWTGGFFSGSLWALHERSKLGIDTGFTEERLVALGRHWQESQRELAYPALDHDQGFRICPNFGREWEQLGVEASRDVMIKAAVSMVERFVPAVGCFRSWEECPADHHHYTKADHDTTAIVIMDNMMNLDLMYRATELTGDSKFAELATKHATTQLKSHIRQDGGTIHVVDFDTRTGKINKQFTMQGLRDDSTWARGQAWGVYGYADTARWTGNDVFLETSCLLADYFLAHLPADGVPHWDFDAPVPDARDISAAMVLACGMLKLYTLLKAKSQPERAQRYLESAVKLVLDCVRLGKPTDSAYEALFGYSTIAGHAFPPGHKWHGDFSQVKDVGLVYADYYFLEFGNELLKLARTDESVASTAAKINP